MQQSMGARDAAYIRRWVSEQCRQLADRVESEQVIDAAVDHLSPFDDLDHESLIREVAGREVSRWTRVREQGVRRAERTRDETGRAVDLPVEQLLIPQLREAGERKIAHGEATIAEGRRDLAVHGAAVHLCVIKGLDPSSTQIGEVLTRDQIRRIRDNIDWRHAA